jgi:homoserine O-acetyltransferase
LAQAETWKAHNVGATRSFEGDYHKALASIRARVLVMPSVTNTYFPADDAHEEASHIPNATFKPIPSIWGHWAGFGINEADRSFINHTITEFVAEVR